MFDTHDGVESAAPEGATVFEGDVMRSGDDGHAVVLFFDGSTLTLEPLTTIRIDAAHSGGTSTIVRIAQIAGTTWHSVHKLLDRELALRGHDAGDGRRRARDRVPG